MAALSVAFLAHTSTFAILTVAAVVTGVLFRFQREPEIAATGRIVLIATIGAVLIAVGVYYAHFIDVYRDQFARIGTEVAQPAELSDPGGRTMAGRAAAMAARASSRFGWPILILSVVGFWRLTQARKAMRADTPPPLEEPPAGARRLVLGLYGWILACVMFLILGIVTPIDMRHLLAVFPALAILAAIAAAWAWRSGGWWRAASACMLAWAVAVGAREWLRTIT
jgi:hypothetical protein